MSILNVNQIQPVGGGNTVTVSASDVNFSGNISVGSNFIGIVTASTATVATNAQGLTGTPDITVNNIQSGIVTATTFIGNGSGLTGVTASGSGINIKDSGSTVGVAATVDFGTNLNVSPASAGIVTVTVGDTDFEIADKIIHTGDTNTAIRFPADDTITAETGGSERLRITSTGSVGIGTISVPNNFNVEIANNGSTGLNLRNTNDSANDSCRIAFSQGSGNLASSNTFADIFPTVDTVSPLSGHIKFRTNEGNNLVERLRVTSAGLVGIGTTNPTFAAGGGVHLKGSGSDFTSYRVTASSNTGVDFSQAVDGKGYVYNRDNADLIFGTNDTEKLRITSSGQTQATGSGASGSVVSSKVTTNNGGYLAYEALNSSGTSVFSVTHNGRVKVTDGIDFSSAGNASGMTSELLDDYEEGTWTPAVDGGTVNSASWGRYIKIGTRVDLFFRITIDTMDNSTSVFLITGTPFNPMSGITGGFTGSCMTNNIYFQDANATAVVTYNASTTNGIRLYSMENNGVWRSLRRVEVNAVDSVYGTSSFRVD